MKERLKEERIKEKTSGRGKKGRQRGRKKGKEGKMNRRKAEKKAKKRDSPSVGRMTSWNVSASRNLLNISSAWAGRSMGSKWPVRVRV